MPPTYTTQTQIHHTVHTCTRQTKTNKKHTRADVRRPRLPSIHLQAAQPSPAQPSPSQLLGGGMLRCPRRHRRSRSLASNPLRLQQPRLSLTAGSRGPRESPAYNRRRGNAGAWRRRRIPVSASPPSSPAEAVARVAERRPNAGSIHAAPPASREAAGGPAPTSILAPGEGPIAASKCELRAAAAAAAAKSGGVAGVFRGKV